MANEVKWVKIVTDIFDDEKMYAIECMPDGRDIELVWFKLLCLAGKCNQNGFLMITNKLAYTDEMLSKIFRMDLGIVQRALGIFQQLDMVEVVDNAYMVSNWLIYQSGDRLEEIKEKNKIRQQRYRDNQKENLIEEKRNVTRNVTHNVTNNVTPSYSISNSNYINTVNILNLYIDKYTYINNNSILKDSILEWMTYKDSSKPKSKHHYGTEMGLMKLLSQIQAKAETEGIDYVVANIDNSIAHTWIGITWTEQKPKFEKAQNISKKVLEEW